MPPARPILFSAPMIRALLDGRKTQTRRIMKPQPHPDNGVVNGDYCASPDLWFPTGSFSATNPSRTWKCPYGRPDELLWVRESFISGFHADQNERLIYEDKDGNELPLSYWYKADKNPRFGWLDEDGYMTDRIPWKPSIHMPRVASRLTLELTEVRAQRIQEITEADAIAEGIYQPFPSKYASSYFSPKHPDGKHRIGINAVEMFEDLWKAINGAGSWGSNPWVWALTFKVQKCNVDDLLSQKAA